MLEENMYNHPKTKEWQQMEDVAQPKLDPSQHLPESLCSPRYQADTSFFLTWAK